MVQIEYVECSVYCPFVLCNALYCSDLQAWLLSLSISNNFFVCSYHLFNISFEYILLHTSVLLCPFPSPLYLSFTTSSLITAYLPRWPSRDSSSLERKLTQSACCVITVFPYVCKGRVTQLNQLNKMIVLWDVVWCVWGFVVEEVQRAWLNRKRKRKTNRTIFGSLACADGLKRFIL